MWSINDRSKIRDKKAQFRTDNKLQYLEIKNNSIATSTSINLQQNG